MTDEPAASKPKRSEKRQRQAVIEMRVLPAERDIIVGAAARAGVTVSEFTRRASLDRVGYTYRIARDY